MDVLSFLRGIQDGFLDAQILAGVKRVILRTRIRSGIFFSTYFFMKPVPKREDYFDIKQKKIDKTKL